MSYLEKLSEIDRLQNLIQQKGEYSEEIKKKINYKFRLDWNFYSNSMEGNSLTKEETRSVMIGLSADGKPLKDVFEMKGHDDIINEILKIGKGEVRISEKRIKEIHKAIMHEENPDQAAKIGIWKPEPNYIYNYKGERFDFVSPEDVPERMHQLLNTTNAAVDAIWKKQKNAPHPIDIAFNFHYEYVSIHPFFDGNGRTSRILTNLLLISFGYPPIIIRGNDKEKYYQYLADIQGYGGDNSLLYDLLADQVIRSQQLVLDAIDEKNIEEGDDLDKEIQLAKIHLRNLPERYGVRIHKAAVLKLLEEVVIPGARFVFEKLKQFDEDFIDTKYNLQVMIANTGRSVPEDTDFENLLNLIIPESISKFHENATHMQIQISKRSEGLKRHHQATSQYLNIEFKFSDFYLECPIDHGDKDPLKIPYDKPFEWLQVEKVMRAIVRNFINRLNTLTAESEL